MSIKYFTNQIICTARIEHCLHSGALWLLRYSLQHYSLAHSTTGCTVDGLHVSSVTHSLPSWLLFSISNLGQRKTEIVKKKLSSQCFFDFSLFLLIGPVAVSVKVCSTYTCAFSPRSNFFFWFFLFLSNSTSNRTEVS